LGETSGGGGVSWRQNPGTLTKVYEKKIEPQRGTQVHGEPPCKREKKILRGKRQKKTQPRSAGVKQQKGEGLKNWEPLQQKKTMKKKKKTKRRVHAPGWGPWSERRGVR